jgi:uncharacterized damage-inducible protein DinB
MDTATLFTQDTRSRMLGETLPRIERAVAALAPEDLWWRPHEGTTSVGILLRHLAGNIRQWIVSGLGGAPDGRRRAEEFEGAPGPTAADLMATLRETIEQAAEVIGGLTKEQLLAEHEIQGYRVRGLPAVYHVIEHLGWHTGQIAWIAKARGGPGHGIAFYDDAKLNADRNPPPTPSG